MASVANVRQWTFLNFSDNWRSDFTVAIRATNRRQFLSRGPALAKLEGKRVLVRGWIERWNGPVIKATHPEQIEVLAEQIEVLDGKSQPAVK